MLDIALCDDDAEELAALAHLVDCYASQRPGTPIAFRTFRCAEDVLDAIDERGFFDAYLLDVIMPGIDGIELGSRLREAGDTGSIVYLSTSRDFAVESYRVRAFDYLLKPIGRKQLFDRIDALAERAVLHDSRSIIVPTPGGEVQLPLSSILYAERAGRSVSYRCTDGTVKSRSIRSSFKDAVSPLLCDKRFVQCGASFAVNLEQVKKVGGGQAYFANGSALCLPRSAAAQFKHAWGRFWLDEDAAHA